MRPPPRKSDMPTTKNRLALAHETPAQPTDARCAGALRTPASLDRAGGGRQDAAQLRKRRACNRPCACATEDEVPSHPQRPVGRRPSFRTLCGIPAARSEASSPDPCGCPWARCGYPTVKTGTGARNRPLGPSARVAVPALPARTVTLLLSPAPARAEPKHLAVCRCPGCVPSLARRDVSCTGWVTFPVSRHIAFR